MTAAAKVPHLGYCDELGLNLSFFHLFPFFLTKIIFCLHHKKNSKTEMDNLMKIRKSIKATGEPQQIHKSFSFQTY